MYKQDKRFFSCSGYMFFMLGTVLGKLDRISETWYNIIYTIGRIK